MFYLSQLLGTPVEDLHAERVGKVCDVLASAAQVGRDEASYPTVLLVESEKEQLWRVPLDVVERKEEALRLLVPVESLYPADLHSDEVRLAQEVLDKQVIDIQRKKAVRVNDVCLADDWQLLGIDNSTPGLIRRLAPAWLLGNRGRRGPATLISWSRIELLDIQRPESSETTNQVQTILPRVPSGHLAEMHPADIAEIVHQLTPGQGARIIEGLDDETAADTMEEIDTERQRHILENIQPDRAADILQAMGPDEAADLLSQMPEERVQTLLGLMTPKESEDVQELLGYEADTAGGLMTTDYIVLNQNRVVNEALEAVRANIKEQDVRIAYIYCVADETQEENRVLGVVSLWDLLMAEPGQKLEEFMETDVIAVLPETEARAVAEIIAKYNLLAVPVVNADGFLEGVVTVDDALDVLLPPERRRKPIRMY